MKLNIPDLTSTVLDDEYLADIDQPGHWVLTLISRGEADGLEFQGGEFNPPSDAYKINDREHEQGDDFDDETCYIHFHVLEA